MARIRTSMLQYVGKSYILQRTKANYQCLISWKRCRLNERAFVLMVGAQGRTNYDNRWNSNVRLLTMHSNTWEHHFQERECDTNLFLPFLYLKNFHSAKSRISCWRIKRKNSFATIQDQLLFKLILLSLEKDQQMSHKTRSFWHQVNKTEHETN